MTVADINYQDSETAVERRPLSAKILKHQLAATFTMHSDYRADFLRFFERVSCRERALAERGPLPWWLSRCRNLQKALTACIYIHTEILRS